MAVLPTPVHQQNHIVFILLPKDNAMESNSASLPITGSIFCFLASVFKLGCVLIQCSVGGSCWDQHLLLQLHLIPGMYS